MAFWRTRRFGSGWGNRRRGAGSSKKSKPSRKTVRSQVLVPIVVDIAASTSAVNSEQPVLKKNLRPKTASRRKIPTDSESSDSSDRYSDISDTDVEEVSTTSNENEIIDSDLEITNCEEITKPDAKTDVETPANLSKDDAVREMNQNQNGFMERRSSSMKLFEDFDIDKFIGNVTNTENVDDSDKIQKERIEKNVLTDDNFFDNLPNINEFSKIKKSSRKIPKSKESIIVSKTSCSNSPVPIISKVTNTKKKMQLKQSIADYAVVNDNDDLELSSTSYELCRDESLTSSLKRQIDKIFMQDGDENQNNKVKKIKIDEDGISPSKNYREPYEVESNSFNENEEVEDITEEGIMETSDNELENDMSFPNLSEDINFDVNALLRKPSRPNATRDLGEKALETYERQKELTTECIARMYNAIQNAPKDSIERDPIGLTVKLMPHQRQSLQWMKWREKQKPSGGILADDMGLGKTLQMISLILSTKIEKKERQAAAGIIEESDDELDNWDLDLEDCGSSRKIYDGRTLLVCPASLTTQWEREVFTRVRRNKLKVYIYHGATRALNVDERKLSKYDLVITTYNIVAQEMDLCIAPKKNKDSRLFRIHWERVILDEAHFIRNSISKASKAVCELRTKSRWALTGTPIQNKEDDFYTLLKFLKCSPFDDHKVWKHWVNNKNTTGNQRLVVISKSVMLRRTKEELMNQGSIERLPDKQYEIIDVKMDPEERMVYQKMLLYSSTFFEEFLRLRLEKEHGYSRRRATLMTKEIPDKMSKLFKVLMKTHVQVNMNYILVLILRLRQMCCHPALVKTLLDKIDIDPDENGIEPQSLDASVLAQIDDMMSDDDDDDDFDIDENYAKKIMSKTNEVFNNRRKGSKVRAVLNVIDKILDQGEKVIVVSQWTGFLQVIADNLNTMPGAKYEIFSGKVSLKNRQAIVDRLNDNNGDLNVLLLSLTAGGVGLNLVGANNLLLIDLHWNPQWETQAQDRIYRFGQNSNVHVYKFICKDSIEEKIKLLQDGKLQIANNLLTGTVSNRLTIEDLKTLFSMSKDPAEENE